jgi:hypothetical protein
MERILPTMAKTTQNTICHQIANCVLLEDHLSTSLKNVQFVVRASIKTPTTHLDHRVHRVMDRILPTMAKTTQNTICHQIANCALLEDHLSTSLKNVQFVEQASIKTPTTK